MPNVLLLGGTTEASALAGRLADEGIATTLSYAGRTDKPRPQPVRMRVGGFGGVAGLAAYLRDHGVTHLVDATHPFAATMSRNAIEAAGQAGVPVAALSRPAWEPALDDRWIPVADIGGAVEALAGPERRVMLALGRMHVEAFAAQPQHRYLLRFIDTPKRPPALPHHNLVVDRGPFTVEGDLRLLQGHAIDIVVCKNAGGTGAEAKLIAARRLGLPVVMVERPMVPDRLEFHDPDALLRWLRHCAAPVAERGV